jgi:hypothetical protein
MKFSAMKKMILEYGWLIAFIIIFIFGLGFIVWMGNITVTSGISPSPKIDPIVIEYDDDDEINQSPYGKLSPSWESPSGESPSGESPSGESPSPEIQNDLEEDLDTLGNNDELCPTLLIKRGNKLMLFNKNIPETPGENPIFFENLNQYTKYVKTQKELYNQNCPVLFLQEEVNAQGENVYRLRKTMGTTTNVDPLLMGSLNDYFKNQTNVMPQFAPPVGPQAFNQVQPNQQLPLANFGAKPMMGPHQKQLVPYDDANRDNKPYNQGFFGFDPTNQYVGKYTVIDEIHDSTKTSNQDGLSDNPMDPNWGGAVFTNKKIDSGKYKENEVQPPTVNNALSFGDYPKAIEDDDIPTPKKVE